MSDYVLQVWYLQKTPFGSEGDEKEAWWDPEEDDLTKDGCLMWRRSDGTPVFNWSVDLMVVGDERFVIFGPFDSADDARTAAKGLIANGIDDGYRILQSHHVFYYYPQLKESSIWYTDG